MRTIYVVESRGEFDSQWGYFWEFFRTQRLAREYIAEQRKSSSPGERFLVFRYRRSGRVR